MSETATASPSDWLDFTFDDVYRSSGMVQATPRGSCTVTFNLRCGGGGVQVSHASPASVRAYAEALLAAVEAAEAEPVERPRGA